MNTSVPCRYRRLAIESAPAWLVDLTINSVFI